MASLDPTFLLALSLYLFLVLSVTPLARASSPPASGFLAHRCSNQVIESKGAVSFFENGLRRVLFDLMVSVDDHHRHHSSSRGLGDDGHVMASFFCWRHTTSEICKKCVKSATNQIQKRCRNHTSAIVWHEGCTLHYVSSPNILQVSYKDAKVGANHEEPSWTWWYNVSCDAHLRDEQPNSNLRTMTNVMGSLVNEATGSGVPEMTPKLYATYGDKEMTSETLHGVVECGPMESYDMCRKCLSVGLDMLIGGCGGSTVARVLLPSCWLGYRWGASTSGLLFVDDKDVSSILSSFVQVN